ncbi:MAG: SGNH/GDSL hydrolase family protein [Methylocella sp.]
MAAKIFKALRIAAVPFLLTLIAWVELKQPYPYFRLLSFVFGFLCIACLASLARGLSRDLLTILASLAFGLCALEIAATLLEPKTALNVSAGWADYEPVLGWGASKPGTYHATSIDAKTGATIYSVDYTFDANLLRRTLSADSGRPIIFFGDSFTFGFGLNDADTLPQAFADLLQRKQRVLNLANGGFSPQQFLRTLETGFRDNVIGPDPKLFIFLTAAWHAERTACKSAWGPNAPRYTLENGALTFKGRCFEGRRLQAQQILSSTAAYRYFVEPYVQRATHDDVELYIREMTAAVALAKEKYHVETLIPYVRSPPAALDNTGFTDDAIMQRLCDGGAIVVDASLQKERADGATLEIPGDGHPTPLANRLRAELIKSFIAQHMSGTLLSQQE